MTPSPSPRSIMGSSHPIIATTSIGDDWRCFERGVPLLGKDSAIFPPGFAYLEWMCEFAVSPRVRLQTVTVAREREADPSQHIIARRSTDGGATWSAWFDVEPEGGRLSSYGTFIRHPGSGRVYFIYNFGPQHAVKDPRRAPAGEPLWAPHHVGHPAIRHVDDQGNFAAQRHLLDLPQSAIDRENVFSGAHAMFYEYPTPEVVVGGDAYGWYVKLGPRDMVNNGELFFVRFHDYVADDRLETLRLSLLPGTDRGIQGPDSPCVAAVGALSLSDDRWFFTFRTTSGYAGFAATSDQGRTVRSDHLRYQPGGRPVKNPEGPLIVTRDHLGRTYLCFYNSSFHPGGGHRDQVFISHVRIDGDRITISEPELFQYHDDQSGVECLSIRRLNCPKIVLTPDGPVGESSDKTGIRRFPIPPAFLDALADQWTASGVPAQGLALHRPGLVAEVDVPRLPALDAGGGWSISFTLRLDALVPGQVVLDGWQGDGGVKATIGADGSLVVVMGDGTRIATIASDPQSLTVGTHRITITADGMPALLSMVIDGRFQDGGAARHRGTVWFDHSFTSPMAKERWTVGANLSGVVSEIHVHDRFLLTSEAVALHRHLATLP